MAQKQNINIGEQLALGMDYCSRLTWEAFGKVEKILWNNA